VLGPSTIQPLVATGAVDASVVESVQSVVTAMRGEGLERGLVERFVAIDDAAYDDIRSMLRAVEG